MKMIFIVFLLLLIAQLSGYADTLFVVNYDDNSVSIVDTTDDSIYATIELTTPWPKYIAARPQADYAFVTNFASEPYYLPWVLDGNDPADYIGDTVTVIDLSSIPPGELTTIPNLGISSLAAPSGIDITSDGSRAYVTNALDLSVAVIDTNPASSGFCTIITKIDLQPYVVFTGPYGLVFDNPWSVTINPAGTLAYVVCQDTSWWGGADDRVVVIDINTNTVTGYFTITSSLGYGSNPAIENIAINQAGDQGFVTILNNFGVPGGGFDGSFVSVCTLNPPPGTENLWIGVDPTVSFYGTYDVIYTQDGSQIITGVENIGSSAYDTNLAFVGTSSPYTAQLVVIGTGAGPRGIEISTDGAKAYTALYYDSAVSKVDIASRTVDGNITVGSGPLGVDIISASIVPNQNVTIITSSIGDSVAGESYSVQLVATGGAQPYAWSIVTGSGSLPSGLNLNGSTGAITGTPTIAGNYSFTVQVQDSSLPVSTDTQYYEMEVSSLEVAEIGYSPSTFTFTSVTGGSNPVSQTLNIFNNVPGSVLNWAVDDNASWLSIGPVFGTSTGENDPVTLTLDITDLTAGTYTATVRITGNATNSPRFVTVTLIVNADEIPPLIQLSPYQTTFYAAQGLGDPDPQTLNIWNSGTEVLNWSLEDDADWLNMSIASGSSTGETDTVSMSVDSTSLTIGEYYGFVMVSSPDASNSPQVVAVTLVVESPFSEISRYPEKMTFYAVTDGSNPPYQTLSIWDLKVAPLSWSIVDNAEWLTCQPASGTATKTISSNVTVGVNIAGLAKGNYHATITIMGQDAVNSPQSISVTLNLASPSSVLPPPTLVSPYNGTSVTTPNPAFDWDPLEDFANVTYIIQVDDDNDFDSPVRYISGLGGTDYTPYGGLLNGDYYWRVRAMNDEGQAGSWSGIWKVTVNSVGSGKGVIGSQMNGGTNNSFPSGTAGGSTTTVTDKDSGSTAKTCFIKSLLR